MSGDREGVEGTMLSPVEYSWNSADVQFMSRAIELARMAEAAGEVPVGAVVAKGAHVIGRGRERKIELSDPTAHAEVLAIREAAASLKDWRLGGCVLVTTLEPCPLCAGAALLARVPLIVYGAKNEKFGPVQTIMPLLSEPRWNHSVETIAGVLEDECAQLLRLFFADRRKNKTD